MGKLRIKPNYRRRVLRLPDLDHCKLAVKHALAGARPSARERFSGMRDRRRRQVASAEALREVRKNIVPTRLAKATEP
jgi:hypothetical protein